MQQGGSNLKMSMGATLFFAFFLFFAGCSTQKGVIPSSPTPFQEPIYHLDEYLSGIPPETKTEEKLEKRESGEEKIVAKEEEKEEEVQVSSVAIPAEPPEPRLDLPDLVVSDLLIKKKRRLVATLANAGTAPFPMGEGDLNLFVDNRLVRSYPLKSLSDRTWLHPQESLTLSIPFSVFGRHLVEARIETPAELKELDKENNGLKKVLEGLPAGPDIVIRDFHLTEDLDLNILLSNAGEIDLRKGVTLRIRIYLNDQKVSDFEHFVSEELKAHSKNLYAIFPPYRIYLKGSSRVRVFLTPRFRSDDIFLENNSFERRILIFPFQLGPQGREQFSFLIPPLSLKDEDAIEKMKMELRWEGGTGLLKFSVREPEGQKEPLHLSGKSPLKVEWPISSDTPQKEGHWMVSVTNPLEYRVEGHLIIQHP